MPLRWLRSKAVILLSRRILMICRMRFGRRIPLSRSLRLRSLSVIILRLVLLSLRSGRFRRLMLMVLWMLILRSLVLLCLRFRTLLRVRSLWLRLRLVRRMVRLCINGCLVTRANRLRSAGRFMLVLSVCVSGRIRFVLLLVSCGVF